MGCGLGYRTRYIQNVAAQASSGTLDLGALALPPDDALFPASSSWTASAKGSKTASASLAGPYRDGSH